MSGSCFLELSLPFWRQGLLNQVISLPGMYYILLILAAKLVKACSS